jgi:N,N'-diacetyllegionaminate synthase
MQIGAHRIEDRVAIVAEIGNNHEGSLDVARRLVEAAARAGVDAVKFQTFRTRFFTSGRDRARFERLSSFELSEDAFRELAGLARSLGLGFLSTPLDLGSARFLEPLVDVFKIASGDNDFLPLMAQVARTGKPLIISTGLAELAHLQRIKAFVEGVRGQPAPPPELAFLHCVCAYPAPPEQANLRAIPLLAEALACTVGYSDHTTGPEACLAAVSVGARIIEKHFTLDKHFSEFRDHQLSADPDEMKRIVEGIRRIEVLLGKREKRVQPAEVANQQVARRSIVAARDLPAGHRLSWEDLTWIRPAGGLAPGNEEVLLGKSLQRAVSFGEMLTAAELA